MKGTTEKKRFGEAVRRANQKAAAKMARFVKAKGIIKQGLKDDPNLREIYVQEVAGLLAKNAGAMNTPEGSINTASEIIRIVCE